jgi:hypothetical protein
VRARQKGKHSWHGFGSPSPTSTAARARRINTAQISDFSGSKNYHPDVSTVIAFSAERKIGVTESPEEVWTAIQMAEQSEGKG